MRHSSSPNARFTLRDLFVYTSLVAGAIAVARLIGGAWGGGALLYSVTVFRAVRDPQNLRQNVTTPHLFVFIGLWFVFTLFTFLFVCSNFVGTEMSVPYAVLTSVACITGPFTGAISRDLMWICVEFGTEAVPYWSSAIGFALIAHVESSHTGNLADGLRLAIWTIGWLIWFASSTASLGFAV